MSEMNALFRRRIGVPENKKITFEALDWILEQTARTIPFENLCIISCSKAGWGLFNSLSLSHLDADSIPCKFLNSIDGTPLEGRKELDPRKCLKLLAMMRFVNPTKEIRMAGGWEVNLRSMQAMGLYAANFCGRLSHDGWPRTYSGLGHD